jgi:hypothetical protein
LREFHKSLVLVETAIRAVETESGGPNAPCLGTIWGRRWGLEDAWEAPARVRKGTRMVPTSTSTYVIRMVPGKGCFLGRWGAWDRGPGGPSLWGWFLGSFGTPDWWLGLRPVRTVGCAGGWDQTVVRRSASWAWSRRPLWGRRTELETWRGTRIRLVEEVRKRESVSRVG